MILKTDMILKRHSITFKVVTMGKLVIIIFLTLLGSFAGVSEAIEQSEVINGEIIGINEERSFIIVYLGSRDGI